MTGFKLHITGAGLHPMDRQRVLKRIQPDSAGLSWISKPGPSSPSKERGLRPPDTELSPTRRVLVKAITSVISPEASSAVEAARLNARQKRKRVQAQTGEILTEEASAERLQEEERSRQAKAAKDKGKGIKGKNLAKGKKGKAASEKATQSKKQQQSPPKETSQPHASAHAPIIESSDSEDEVIRIRPRKPRRKLVVDPEDEAEEAPKSGQDVIRGVFCKIMIFESPDFIQDFEDVAF